MNTAFNQIEPRVLEIDKKLSELDREIDWLNQVSPTHNNERWNLFEQSHFKKVSPLTYEPIKIDTKSLRKNLREIKCENIKHPVFAALLHEKKEELDLFLDLIDNINTDGFLSTSIELFGGASPSLLATAKEILKSLPFNKNYNLDARGADLALAAHEIRAQYQKKTPDFNFKIHLAQDLNAKLMVNRGDLFICESLHFDKARINPLIAHEVEVHALTYFNGSKQPLHLLKNGLAHYDTLQEGLATFAEYLSGNLPAQRLRIIAARVVAADLAIKHEDIKSIFECLNEEYMLSPEAAFETAVRAKRGGGLTKDAVYLKGLQELHAYIKSNSDFEFFFLGKFDLGQRQMVKILLDEGLLIPPTILPNFLTSESGTAWLRKACSLSLNELYH